MLLADNSLAAQTTFAMIFTPQGDGNFTYTASCWASISIRHDIYPARGRKHRREKKLSHCFVLIRHDIYPARGRKLPNFSPDCAKSYRIRHDIYPARGRKLFNTISSVWMPANNSP